MKIGCYNLVGTFSVEMSFNSTCITYIGSNPAYPWMTFPTLLTCWGLRPLYNLILLVVAILPLPLHNATILHP